jgi:hypothetical protein
MTIEYKSIIAEELAELKFRERFHYDKERETCILKWFTDLSLLHDYLVGLKSIKGAQV